MALQIDMAPHDIIPNHAQHSNGPPIIGSEIALQSGRIDNPPPSPIARIYTVIAFIYGQ